MEQALIRDKRWRTLALLPISKNRARYNVTKNNMNTLIKVLKEMEFQYIIVDCPAGIDVGFINAISCADKAVIVTTPEITAIRDADRVAGLLEANGVYDVKLLVNRVADMIKKNDMMSVKDVQEMLGVPLLGAIPEDTEVIVSTNRGEPLVLKKKLTLAGIASETPPTSRASKISSLISTSRRRVFSSAWASSSPATKSDRVVETPSHSRATDVFNRQMCYYNNSYRVRRQYSRHNLHHKSSDPTSNLHTQS